MKKAIVEDGIVLNIIEIEEDSEWETPDGCILIDALNASVGDTWDGEKFITAEEIIDLVSVSHWARVSAFNVGTDKPLEVKRTYQGKEHNVNCYVTQSVVDDYQAGKLAIGDFVIVEFIDGDLDKPLAVAKVYKSW